ncbi:ArsR/SmtB family transcription factor [Corynebacterium auriscanis]|uniref:ArsR/SmtB family transcription factor n=1 Tax=Corynebacterium auriscanis TaxID=99807 RepID=UPI0022459386|nr:MarR family transcriptional regulator [Corynebacterium auriscanis]MCX2162653.1 transcriptional regulator [Corynebacterium auriscanis]
MTEQRQPVPQIDLEEALTVAVPEKLFNQIKPWSLTFKILSDPTRLKLLAVTHHLGPSAATVSELAKATGVSTAVASAALNHMATAGVLTSIRTGREIRYALQDDAIHTILHLIGADHGNRTPGKLTLGAPRRSH